MVNQGNNIKLTFTQQIVVSKLLTKLDALKLKRDKTLQELNEFIQLCTIELNIPSGAIFDQNSMSFQIQQTEKQSTQQQ